MSTYLKRARRREEGPNDARDFALFNRQWKTRMANQSMLMAVAAACSGDLENDGSSTTSADVKRRELEKETGPVTVQQLKERYPAAAAALIAEGKAAARMEQEILERLLKENQSAGAAQVAAPAVCWKTGVDKHKEEWATDANLRKEFSSEAAYLCFRKMQDEGRVRILSR
ncbi:hypothetical protein [Aestuariivirga sp.]|uniref:hypothetical protein n=1 Tax=Aestuariivirga sp. TaxID=2650926 RepID=UPI0039E5AD92